MQICKQNNLQQDPPPSKESPDSIHQESAKDKKKKEVLDRKHTLSCPDPVAMPPMKGIQTTLEKLVKEIQRIQRALTDYAEGSCQHFN